MPTVCLVQFCSMWALFSESTYGFVKVHILLAIFFILNPVLPLLYVIHLTCYSINDVQYIAMQFYGIFPLIGYTLLGPMRPINSLGWTRLRARLRTTQKKEAVCSFHTPTTSRPFSRTFCKRVYHEIWAEAREIICTNGFKKTSHMFTLRFHTEIHPSFSMSN